MPMQYRTRDPSERQQSRPRQQRPQMVTDADDSIVLSDLVRTAEASRLRRRGAMRIDHAPSGSSAAIPVQSQRASSGNFDPPAAIRVRSPTWVQADSGSDDEYTGWAQRETDYEVGQQAENDARRAEHEKERDVYNYVLFCGAEEEESWDDRPTPPAWSPSPLPLYPPSSSRHNSTFSKPRPKRNNGCGAILHMNAAPRRRQGVWTAKSQALDSVVPMEASYFDRKAVVKMLRSACGCVREGVGCAVCGNTLGTRYKPCHAAAEGLFNPRASRHRAHLCPEGPRYWHAHSGSHSSLSKSAASYYVYTFFSSNVTSSPDYTFPPQPMAPPASALSAQPPTMQQFLQPAAPTAGMSMPNATYDPTFFDRPITQSPMPMWEESSEPAENLLVQDPSEGYIARMGGAGPGEAGEILDPDGVVIGTLPIEPLSPDKFAEGISLPDR